MRNRLLLGLFLFLALPALATHQRAAEITYRWMGANTYEFTLTCYTYSPSPAGMQRDSLLMQWGDGFEDYVPRVVYEDLGDDYTLNVYRMTHDFASSGTFIISMEDPDRNYGVVNVPNSVSVPMYIETELVISPFLGYNNSVQLLNPPVDKGCVGKPFYHHPSAYDPDGDSLSYRLIPCKGTGGEDIPGYSYPQSSSLFEIDPVTGVLKWENPVLQGEYNVAILVEEWRHGVKIGSVTRDMQILVNACNDNIPEIVCVDDTCVVAGTSIDFLISGYDPDGDNVTLTASGGPFVLDDSPAVLTPPTAFGLTPSFTFSWNTQCGHVCGNPYQVVVHAKDDAFPIALSNVHIVNITVIGPPVEGLSAELQNGKIALTWLPYACSNAQQLRIYRRTGGWPYVPDPCETGVRPGYQLVAELDGSDATSFVDDNGGQDFGQGLDYCYRLVAVFYEGIEGAPSEEACVHLKNTRPLMTHVSNDSLDLTTNQVLLGWMRPQEIEPYHTEPFTYRLIRYMNGMESMVYEGADTVFRDVEADLSQVQSLRYRVEMRDAAQQLVGNSVTAEALLLSGLGGDARVVLSWTEEVPWMIDSIEVYKENDRGFVKIGATVSNGFVDTAVENGVEYRYYVRSFGHYVLEGLQQPLVNWSAIVSVTPDDDEPPAPPRLEVEPDCDAVENILTWHGEMEDDLAGFQIYYTASLSEGFDLLETLTNPMDTTYLHKGLLSTAGCYYMKAFDEKGNFSQPTDTVCIAWDACPVYELPNVFTPNGDGVNDIFEPIHIARVSIDHVEMHVFNRWGRPVFDTEDPFIHWDGRAMGTRMECPDGTYFYVCDVYIKTPEGVVTQRLQGVITLLR
ncbi:MAG: gliding motility-associated C-terminal domain-containing protein [Bacteroidales bacterium]|nr:gliding motility-associated C-terminal domain-containing protein [Bacteroidales bacterium]